VREPDGQALLALAGWVCWLTIATAPNCSPVPGPARPPRRAAQGARDPVQFTRLEAQLERLPGLENIALVEPAPQLA
jgi:hypothetical protein